jgi:hypothetical protein
MATRPRRPINPLDAADLRFGRNPRELSEASRRSQARVGAMMPRGDGRMAPDPRDRAAIVTEHRLQLARGTPNPRKRRGFTDAAGRKGGPGKRRPTPKKGRAHHG